eukprot:GHVL01010175.1.p1 GENE.GHVL01010175.1~~GHVL01010175.1.p1  ORF type:complete len:159 (+),score=26.42 GHVL01010175.1:23-499(+)
MSNNYASITPLTGPELVFAGRMFCDRTGRFRSDRLSEFMDQFCPLSPILRKDLLDWIRISSKSVNLSEEFRQFLATGPSLYQTPEQCLWKDASWRKRAAAKANQSTSAAKQFDEIIERGLKCEESLTKAIIVNDKIIEKASMASLVDYQCKRREKLTD